MMGCLLTKASLRETKGNSDHCKATIADLLGLQDVELGLSVGARPRGVEGKVSGLVVLLMSSPAGRPISGRRGKASQMPMMSARGSLVALLDPGRWVWSVIA
jgi:hypothetical protein